MIILDFYDCLPLEEQFKDQFHKLLLGNSSLLYLNYDLKGVACHF